MSGRATLEEAERAIMQAARAAADQLPRGWGFGLFAFSVDNAPGQERLMTWASNCDRTSVICSLREWLATNPESRERDTR